MSERKRIQLQRPPVAAVPVGQKRRVVEGAYNPTPPAEAIRVEERALDKQGDAESRARALFGILWRHR